MDGACSLARSVPRALQRGEHAEAQLLRSAPVGLAGGCQRREERLGESLVRQASGAAREMPPDGLHAIVGQLLVEVVPELLDGSRAVDLCCAISHWRPWRLDPWGS